MFHSRPNWKFHIEVITKALDILETATNPNTEPGDYSKHEAPISIEEARASLASLITLISSNQHEQENPPSELRKLA